VHIPSGVTCLFFPPLEDPDLFPQKDDIVSDVVDSRRQTLLPFPGTASRSDDATTADPGPRPNTTGW
jgi:hypothetical protein